ncbi:MAG: HAMP domain-containing histidine kinase [Vallitaleaceae bacterium]|nr:HAMP domain-containing histidine kinase [Vallitaleaceae bacterium]
MAKYKLPRVYWNIHMKKALLFGVTTSLVSLLLFSLFWGKGESFTVNGIGIGVSFVAFLIITTVVYLFLYEKNRLRLKIRYSETVEKEKIAAMSKLVAGVAHEINSPLGVSLTTVSFIDKINRSVILDFKENTLRKESLDQYFDEMQEAIVLLEYNLNRAADFVKNFKQMASSQAIFTETNMSLKKIADEVIFSLKHEYKNKNLTILNHIPEDLNFKSFPTFYIQIFTNLLMNSIIHGFRDRKKGIIEFYVQRNEKHLAILYKDDGVGIDEKYKNHIFDPFYTTNGENGSSGLGLSIIHSIVAHELKGQISYQPNLPSGVLFRIDLDL